MYPTKYKIGDKVICPRKPRNTNQYPGWDPSMNNFLGFVGVITNIDTNPLVYEVNFEEVTGRDLDFWYYREEWIEPATVDQKFLIVTDNKKIVTVTDKETNITAEARCHPDDKFDLITGITIATNRVLVANKMRFYTGPVFCAKASSKKNFTVGYVYHVYGGDLVDDGGYTYHKIEDIEDYFGSSVLFVPFKGIRN